MKIVDKKKVKGGKKDGTRKGKQCRRIFRPKG